MLDQHQIPEKQALPGSRFLVAALAAGALLIGACASTPQPPTEELQAAESAIANAEQSRVADYASAELTQAREKLTAARAAARNENMQQAEYLAVESRVHADLAHAQAEELKAKAVNDEMQRNIETLRSEMNRARGIRE